MPLEIVRNDITKMQVDAIVSPSDPVVMSDGGASLSIMKAAGEKFLAECKKVSPVMAGETKITAGYNLPAKYVIHTVGPVWQGGNSGEEKILRSCYREALLLAKKKRCKSLAFPLISSGAFGYPSDKALKIAVDEISTFLFENEMFVYIVVFSKEVVKISEKLFSNIAKYIDDNYCDEFAENTRRIRMRSPSPYYAAMLPCEDKGIGEKNAAPECSLEAFYKELDESFSQMLLRKIDEAGIKDSECYKKANVDRKLFSKIRNNIHYKPSKTTAIAFAIALQLSFDETEELLRKAGFALSHSNRFDIIIEYFIKNSNYDVFEINEALFAFDQPLLGV